MESATRVKLMEERGARVNGSTDLALDGSRKLRQLLAQSIRLSYLKSSKETCKQTITFWRRLLRT